MSGLVDVDASAGLGLADASKPRARAGSGKFQTLDDAGAHSPPCGKLQHPPLSPQVSTAPSTPSLSFNIDGEGHGPIFYRCISGTSTIEPVIENEYDEDGLHEASLPPLPWLSLDHEVELDRSLTEVKEIYKSTVGKDVDEESDAGEEPEYEYDEDGTPWVKHVGTGPLTLSVLDFKLAEVKELFKAKYGQDVDAESEEYEYDGDGTPWTKTVGTGPLTAGVLEEKLAEVKELYKAAYGQGADAESDDEDFEYDEEGTPWIKTVGTGPLTVDVLEDFLAEVKELYKAAYGQDADAESDDEDFEYDKDGTPWTKIVGTGPLTVSVLEDSLAEVKELFKAAYGQEIDAESDDEDGTPWIKTVGTGPLTEQVLEDRLAEVKDLFRQKYGQDADDESEGFEYDADGTPWIKTVGTGPLTVDVLEERLTEVKELYQERYGKGVDEPDDDDHEYEYDEEGTPWIKVVGTGPLTVETLEKGLAEVKDLYKHAFGRDVDESDSDDSGYDYDADGTPWVKFVGEGPLTVSVLEDKLAEVKALYAEKYGRDADEESEGDGQVEYDEEGTPWIKTVGTGPLTVSVLEERIDEVKELYERRFGRFVEEESEDEEPDLQYDPDGTLWFKWEGVGASSCGP